MYLFCFNVLNHYLTHKDLKYKCFQNMRIPLAGDTKKRVIVKLPEMDSICLIPPLDCEQLEELGEIPYSFLSLCIYFRVWDMEYSQERFIEYMYE